MDAAFKTFEDLIRRIFGPATAFFPLLFLAHWIEFKFVGDDKCVLVHSEISNWLRNLQANDLPVLAGGLLILIGTGYVMSTLHSLLFDHFLHNGFDSCFNNSLGQDDASPTFNQLRAQAIEKLKRVNRDSEKWLKEAPSDYLLYEIIGGIDKSSTKPAVDSAKTYGIVTIGAILATLSTLSCLNLCAAFLIYPLCVVFWCLGRMLVKAQYRWRAVRHYVNLLMWPDYKIRKILADYKEESCKEEKTDKK